MVIYLEYLLYNWAFILNFHKKVFGPLFFLIFFYLFIFSLLLCT